MTPLSAKRRSELRAQAHALNPLVIIGDKGLTDEVIAEIDRSLKAHELIKVRASSAAREQRDVWLETICERLAAHAVQQIGKVFVLYREKPEEEPAPKAPRPDGTRRRPKVEVVSARGKLAQRARDAAKQRQRDIREMKAKGKIPANAKIGPAYDLKAREREVGDRDDAAIRTSRPRSRTPSPLPESGPRRRRPRTSR
jgi:putative YhbY family RNA-binding protein